MLFVHHYAQGHLIAAFRLIAEYREDRARLFQRCPVTGLDTTGMCWYLGKSD